ncbi:Kelch repeat-containing protein [Formosa sp. S-31]|uniref:Kelch repeat-containing protein n=1 Tax=Formosa sp. S-31 TaxID=2790949 RepID=UPI003EB91B71
MISYSIFSQTFEGTVLDNNTGIPLEGANLYITSLKTGASTNTKGQFKISIPSHISQTDSILCSHLGYYPKTISYSDFEQQKSIIQLQPKIESLKTIQLTGSKHLFSSLPFKQLQAMPEAVSAFGSTRIDNKIYVVGGDASVVDQVVQSALHNTSNNARASLSDLMKDLRYDSTWESFSTVLQIYDIASNSWTTSDLKLRKRAYQTVEHFNNQLYIFGGIRLSTNHKLQYLDDKIEVIDIVNNTKLIDDTNPHQTANAASFRYQNKIIVLGGSTKISPNGKKTFTDAAHLYNLETGYWYALKNMPEAKASQGVLIKNIIYLIGGNNGKPLAHIDTYNINTGNWQHMGDTVNAMEAPAVTANEHMIYIYDKGQLITFNTLTTILNCYNINLTQKQCALYCCENHLYLIGGFTENNFLQSPSAQVYSIDIDEFLNTKIKASKHLENP